MAPEVTRCRPVKHTRKCGNCKRWCGVQAPGLAAVVNTAGPRDLACVYLPVSFISKPRS